MPILGNKAFQIYHKLASTLYIDRWIQTYTYVFANKLKCKVQAAVFIFINRVKQQCQHVMRLLYKPYPILVVMQSKSGLFGSNIA